jgi:hypothetical protein
MNEQPKLTDKIVVIVCYFKVVNRNRTMLSPGVSDAIIRKMTGHSSDELERCKHLSPEFSRQSTELIAGKLMDELNRGEFGTKRATSPENEESRQNDGSQTLINE